MIKSRGSTLNRLYYSMFRKVISLETALAVSYNVMSIEVSVKLIVYYPSYSYSSCHQTSVFHLSTHFFAVSLNLLRSSNEQGCARRVHCIMCAVFSVASPHSQVVSPS